MKQAAGRKAKNAARVSAKRTTKTKRKSAPDLRASRGKNGAPKKSVTKKIEPRDAFDALVDAGAKALGLPLDSAWHAGVRFNLQLILRHATLVEEFSLPDDAEPAPVYHA